MIKKSNQKLKTNSNETVGVAYHASRNAITLIALVITIIVLLILAGVTINLVLGPEGLLKQAQDATDKYKQAENEELNNMSNLLAQLEEINNESDGGIGTPSEPKIENLATKAQPGDYIKYIVPTKTFSMSTEETGYSSVQTYSTNDYEGLWQVLYNDGSTIEIISANDVTNGKKLYLGIEDDKEASRRAYNNGITTLNTFCSNFVNSIYSTKGRSVGSDPTNPENLKTDYFTLPFTCNGSNYSGCRVSNNTCSEDMKAMASIVSQNESENIGIIGVDYWLASSNVYSSSTICQFYLHYYARNGGYSSGSLLQFSSPSSEKATSCGYAVRACITLKSEIKTNKGNGTREYPYELVIEL